MSLLTMDASEVEELKQQGRFVIQNCPPPSMIARHWRTRPQARKCLLYGILIGAIMIATLLLDSHFRGKVLGGGKRLSARVELYDPREQQRREHAEPCGAPASHGFLRRAHATGTIAHRWLEAGEARCATIEL